MGIRRLSVVSIVLTVYRAIKPPKRTGHPTGCPVLFPPTRPLRLGRHRGGGWDGRVRRHVVVVFAGIGGGVGGVAAAAEVAERGVAGVGGLDAAGGGAAPGGFGVRLLAPPRQKFGGG